MMLLKDLLFGLEYNTKSDIGQIPINEIQTDSRLVARNDLFVAIKGEEKDGHSFIKKAFEQGASAVIGERDMTLLGPGVKVEDTRKALAVLAKNYYRDPSKKIKLIAITGTNGKTTTLFLLEKIFIEAGYACGLIGTVKYKIGKELIEPDNTTPSSLVLQGLLQKMLACSLDYCFMEASSHALAQHRVDCLDFDAGFFTNATSEHLDYHKNFENYLKAKLKLFRMIKKGGVAVINRDDPNSGRVKKACACKDIISFGLTKESDIYADDIHLAIDGSRFTLHVKEKTTIIKSPLIGMHNIYNILCAVSYGVYKGIDLNVIKNALQKGTHIPGRLERIDAEDKVKVFVDYAHTDDALLKVLLALNDLKTKRIITVFGCGGNRDRAKRPRMGKIACRLSDCVIITSDNPRHEDPKTIADEIIKGIENKYENCKVIIKRRDAIKQALFEAKTGDIVLIAGKGHEKYQIIGDKKIPFDDVETVKEITNFRDSGISPHKMGRKPE